MYILSVISLIMGSLSILYFIFLTILNAGAGFSLFWILLSALCFCIYVIIKNRRKIKEYVPKFIRYVVLIIFISLIFIFIILEGFIVKDSIKKDNYEYTDYVIVLGARVKGTKLSLTLSHRLDTAYDYLIKNVESKAVLAGGQGPGEDISEAEAMKKYLIQKGIDEDRLIMENKSTNTQENIKNSFEIIEETNENSAVTIVTSDFHVYRAKGIANKYFQEVQGIPTETHPPLIIHYYVREFFAVVKDIVL